MPRTHSMEPPTAALVERLQGIARKLRRHMLAMAAGKGQGYIGQGLGFADILAALVDLLGNGNVHMRSKITRVDQDEEGASLTLEDGSTHPGELVVGADGIHSVLRDQLFGKSTPRFSGNVAWRGTMPAEAIKDLKLDYLSSNWWGPGRSLVHYYISGGLTHNWIGVGRSEAPSRESWSATGSVNEALAEYAGWHPQVLAVIGATTKLFRMALYDREPLSSWHAGRVVLLGDAAHAMLPFYGQGAAQAVEDAEALAHCLVNASLDNVAGALELYESVRAPRAGKVQLLSRGREVQNHLPDGPEQELTADGYVLDKLVRDLPWQHIFFFKKSAE